MRAWWVPPFFRCPPMELNLWVTFHQVCQAATCWTYLLIPSPTCFWQLCSYSSSPADISSAQCIPAPLATPIPVSDDPTTTVVTSCTDLSESPSSQVPPMQYSVPVSEHMDECSSSVIKDELDSLLESIPKKVSEVSAGKNNMTWHCH